MNNKLFIALVVVAAGALAGWYVLKGKTPAPTSQREAQATPTPSGSNLGAPDAVTGNGARESEKGGGAARSVVTYTDNGFAPNAVTVKAGAIVTFVNESSGYMWVASVPHPVHTNLPGFDELTGVAKGGTYEYTFTKAGTWKYHNHVAPVKTGSVIVTP